MSTCTKQSTSTNTPIDPPQQAIAEYLQDHKAQHHSPKTIERHEFALGNLADFLEKQGVTCLEHIEKVHLLA